MANSEWRTAPLQAPLMARSAAKLRVSNHAARRPGPSFETPRCARLLRMRAERESKLMRLATPLWPRLLIARQRIIRAFPWREKIEFAEFLIETDGFVDHPFLLVVVAHFDEAGEREILAQRMAVKAVVGQQPPHVRMAGEDHAVKIVAFTLEPVGAGKHLDDRRHLGGLIGFGTQPDARVQRWRQKMIDHVEAPLAAGIIHCRHVDEADEAAAGIVAQEFYDIDDPVGLHPHREVVERDRMVGRCTGKRANNRLPQSVEPAVIHSEKTLAFDGSGAPDL